MKLPKYTFKTTRKRIGYCKYEGCGKEFYGSYIQKYCDIHTDPKVRKNKKKKITNIGTDNMILKHTYLYPVDMRFKCSLDGCKKEFKITIYPRTYIYPKYCEDHRAAYKRNLFFKMMRRP